MSQSAEETYPDTMPGSVTAEPSELHPNAVEQDYNLAGGKKTKGQPYTPDYNPVS